MDSFSIVTYPALTSETGVVNTTYPYGDVRRFGAKGDGVADDTTAFANAVTSAAALAFGGTVYISPGVYLLTSQIVAPANVRLVGAGMQSVRLQSNVATFAFKFGGTSGSLSYGCGLESCEILLTNTAGGGFQAQGTAGFSMKDVYIEGVVSGGCTGGFIDGSNAANIFTVLSNFILNHVKTGLRLGSSGSSTTTSVTAMGVNAVCDSVAGSVGLQVDAGNGNGSRFFGGNMEACATGVSIAGFGVQLFGMRFEGNTTDVTLVSGAQLNSIIGSSGLSSYSDLSTNLTNTRLANTSAGGAAVLNLIYGAFTGGIAVDTLKIGSYDHRGETVTVVPAATATTIYTTFSTAHVSGEAIVTGVDASDNWFSDIIHYTFGNSVAVLSSKNNGPPATRSYLLSGTALQLTSSTAQVRVRIAIIVETNAGA